MITSKCTCEGCKVWEATPKALGATKMGPPLEKPKVPGYFKWKAMPAANQYWTYLVTCKMCKWEKFSDYHNALEWLWWHDADDCRNPAKRWSK
jgi:hypothetical protein